MLNLPSKGFRVSVNQHNVDLDSMCDWIEGSITFVDDIVSQSDIVDCLLENNIYRSQDYAKEHIGNAFRELSRRAGCLQSECPFEIQRGTLRRRVDWTVCPAYAFCLMLTLQTFYRELFNERFRIDYGEQGLLFERLTASSIEQWGWKVHSTAWSKSATSSFKEKVDALATCIGERSLSDAVGRWSADDAKDGGLDIVCQMEFADRWPGRPLLFIQCASGEDWKVKRATPNLKLWYKLVDVATSPRRGIAIPFALLADDFRKAANYDKLFLLLDRHRVSAPKDMTSSEWLPKALVDDIVAWVTPRIDVLRSANAAA